MTLYTCIWDEETECFRKSGSFLVPCARQHPLCGAYRPSDCCDVDSFCLPEPHKDATTYYVLPYMMLFYSTCFWDSFTSFRLPIVFIFFAISYYMVWVDHRNNHLIFCSGSFLKNILHLSFRSMAYLKLGFECDVKRGPRFFSPPCGHPVFCILYREKCQAPHWSAVTPLSKSDDGLCVGLFLNAVLFCRSVYLTLDH